MSSKTKYLCKQYLLAVITFAAVAGLVCSAFAMDVPMPTPQELATWPAQVLLAAIALACVTVAYKTWVKSFDLQKNTTDEIRALRELLASRPCVMEADLH